MKSFRELIVTFTDESTIHGLRKACRSKSITLRVLWTILLLASTCLISYQIARLVEKYYRYQINVKTTEVRLPLVPPTVKICNLTPVPIFYFEYYNGSTTLQRYVKTFASIRNLSLDKIQPSIFGKDWENLNTFNITSEDELYDEYRRYTFSLFSKNNVTAPINVASDIGIMDVKVNGQTIKEFESEYDADYGACITILTKEVKQTDCHSGIEIMLYVGQRDYIPLFVQSAGFRVGLAESGTKPDMTRSFLIPPGFKTDLAIQPVISYHVSEPYRHCYNGSEYHSIAACERSCLEEKVYEACNCSLHGEIGRASGLCRTKDECVQKAIDGNLSCTCLEPCRRHTYDVIPSYTQYPSDAYLPIVCKALNDFDPNNVVPLDEMRRNSAALRVYFRRGTTVITEEKLAYLYENLMSDIGGQLGLGLGVSVLSILELIGFIVDIVHSYLSKDTVDTNNLALKMNTTVDQAADKPD